MNQHYKVVITGATGGIGREIVKELDTRSELIILVGLIKDALEDLKSEMKQIANEYKVASEANKPEIFQVLKSKTAAKKELEAKKAQIEKQLKAQIEKQLNIRI